MDNKTTKAFELNVNHPKYTTYQGFKEFTV
jgi:hypothetical protein